VSEALAPAAARALADGGGAAIVDVREAKDFARGHPAGALSVPFSPRGLGDRVRVAIPAGAAVVLLAADDATAEAAATQIGYVGIAVRGFVAGGIAAWHAASQPERSIAEVDLNELAEMPQLSGGATLIDVREPMEWSTGHVPGALLIPLGRLRDALPEVPRDSRVVTICEAGLRSSTAASILEAAGFSRVAHVPVGTGGYRKAGLPLAFPGAEEGQLPPLRSGREEGR